MDFPLPDPGQINLNGPLPLYYQIASLLEEVIRKKSIKPGAFLPPEEVLAAYFGVSRPTISKAFTLLAKKSIISKSRGKRPIVRGQSVNLVFLRELVSFGKELERMKIAYSTKVLESKKIRANQKLAKFLDVKIGTPLFYLKRLRYIENDPAIIVESYLPCDLFPNLLKHDFQNLNLYSILREDYNVFIKKAERWVQAIRSSEEDARLLGISIGDPLLQLESVVISTRETKIEYFNSRLKGEGIVLSATVFPPKDA